MDEPTEIWGEQEIQVGNDTVEGAINKIVSEDIEEMGKIRTEIAVRLILAEQKAEIIPELRVVSGPIVKNIKRQIYKAGLAEGGYKFDRVVNMLAGRVHQKQDKGGWFKRLFQSAKDSEDATEPAGGEQI